MRPVKIEPANDCPKVALKQVLVTYSGASSPRELLENCCIQAQAALKGLEATAVRQDPDMEQEDEEEMKRLSTRDLARRKARRREEENGDENIQLKEFW
jgi:hypothetical protein